MKQIIRAILIPCLILTFNSCKQKGCTDKDSLNYDITAEDDDGSCIYCNSLQKSVANRTVYLIDDYFGSIHYNQNIMQIDISQHSDSFSYEQCGQTACVADMKVKSLVNEDMEVEFRTYSNGNFYFSVYKEILLPAHATMDFGAVVTQSSMNCYPITFSTITSELQSPAVYH